jgi:DNA-binding CsgD family transcriptional regulator
MLADDHRIFHCISSKTVETHRANIVRTTGVQVQVGLTTHAARIVLVDPDRRE